MKRTLLYFLFFFFFIGSQIHAQTCQGDFQFSLSNCPTADFSDLSFPGSGSTISAWAWDFGDGNTSTQQNPSHTYSANGSYIACLSISTNSGCVSSFCDTIDINCIGSSSCQSAFQYTLGACPDIYFFDASTASSGTVVDWFYDFGDGNTSTQQNPVHTYTANGSYVVCLSITTSDSCTNTFCDTLNINCITQPSCSSDFQYSTNNCPDVDFLDLSSAGSGSTISAWAWDFGDGNTSSQQNPSHTYTSNGSYIACLTIVTSNGCSNTYCDTIDINCIGSSSCQAAYQYTLGACPTISFFDGSTSSPGTIIDWYYDFGDGNTSTQQNPTHTYASNGYYPVCLSIITSDSCTSTFCDTLLINCISQQSCSAEFQYSMANCPSIAFTDLSFPGSGATTSYWAWDFGDGNTSSQQNPTNMYMANGTYIACLTITTSDSCTSTFCDTIVVNCINVGLEETGLEDIELFPNPVKDELILRTSPLHKLNYTIYSLDGKALRRTELPYLEEHRIYVDKLSPGSYLLEIRAGDLRRVMRFMKE